MKKNILLFLMIQLIFVVLANAQIVRFGPFAGTLGNKSSYFGFNAGRDATAASTENSFFGYNCGLATIASYNTGFGTYALTSNLSGTANTATGHHALFSNTTANFNTANGHSSLQANTRGHNNTAVGAYSLPANITGVYNTAVGAPSLKENEMGSWNTAIGGLALSSNKEGDSNTATGLRALSSNTRGSSNTANGQDALYYNKIGKFNSAFGVNAGPGPRDVDLVNTTALGYWALPTFSNSVRIGNTSVTSIGGQVMWSNLSDGRFKRNLKEDVSGLDFVNQLRPVSYEIDQPAINKFLNIPDSVVQYSDAKRAPVRETGFVAQEVESIIKKTGYVFSGVETPQNENDPYRIRYAAFVVPLVKAVQELSAKLNEQEKKIEEQQLEISKLKQKPGVDEKSTSDTMSASMKVALFQNNPNPFSQDTEIRMVLPESTRHASVIVYNLEGKELKNIVVNERGDAAIKILGSDLGAGMYLYTLIVDGKVADTKRLILTK